MSLKNMYSTKKTRNKKARITTITSPADRPLLIIITCIALVGLMAVFSASISQNHSDHLFFIKKQLQNFGIGFLALIFFSKFNYKKLQSLCSLIAMGTIGILLLTMVIGETKFGSTRWIMGLQPSELAKFSCLILLADGLVKSDNIFDEVFFKRAVSIVTILLLIALQPDLSTSIVIFTSCVATSFVGGVSFQLLGNILMLAGMLIGFSITSMPHQKARIIGWWNPWADPFDKGYNLIQSWYAISSGGFWGVGFGNSKQKLLWLPLGHIDFIFAIFAEEMGFIGCVVLIGLFLAFMHRGFIIAQKCPDNFGRLLAFGITFCILFQAIVNICVATGLFPVTGVTLPLVSYGGTSILITMSMIGVLLNISRVKIKRINTHGK